MSKVKIHAIGSGFSHDVCSCHKNKPSNFEWVYLPDGEIEVYFEPSFLGGKLSNCKNKFLWLSESKALYFPVYDYIVNNIDDLRCYKKIFVHDYDLLKLDPIFEYCPAGSNKSWIVDGKIYEKTKLASMISSGKNVTGGHKIRNMTMSFLKQGNFGVDFFGRYHNPFNEKEEALADYYFSFVVENLKYPHYYTEKIMDCFATGTIPIYYGSPEIHKEFNQDGIIIYDENFDFNILTKELYFEKMEAIRDNFEREKTHKIADDIIYDLIMKEI